MKEGELTIQFSKKEQSLISKVISDNNFDDWAKQRLMQGVFNLIQKPIQQAKSKS